VTDSRRAQGTAACGLLLTLAAFTFDAAPLFVAGVAFILLGVATPLWVRASARGIHVQRHLLAERVIEGEPVEAVIEVGSGPLGLPGGDVLDPLAGGPISLHRPLSPRARRATAEIRVVARFPRRGRRQLDPPALIVRDVLGLACATCAGTGAAQMVLVLPRIEPVSWTARERGRRSEGLHARALDESLAADVDGLRPYRSGTPASRIQWAALARGAGLQERRLRADGDTRPLIVLDARCTGPQEHLDAAVRAAASLTLELARRGGCRVLLPGERRAVAVEADLVGWQGVHARLALVEGGIDARAPVLTAGARLGPVFYVGAQRERLPAVLVRPGAACVVVLPKALARTTTGSPSFEVAGCRGDLLRSARTDTDLVAPLTAGGVASA
jgi:uncharacterized protein (DUF58 family)